MDGKLKSNLLKSGSQDVFMRPPHRTSPPPPSCTLTHRYNEFHDLHEKIKKLFPEANLKLPGKRFLGNNFDPEFIRARREGLHDFVMNLVKVGGTRGWSHDYTALW